MNKSPEKAKLVSSFTSPQDRLISGAVGGTCSVLLTHPLDTLRVQLQSQSQGNSAGLWTRIQEQSVRSLYRGLGPPLLGVGPIMAVLFVSYEGGLRLFQPWLMPNSSNAKTPVPDTAARSTSYSTIFSLNALAGIVATLPTAVIGIPGERLKILLQLSNIQDASAASNQSRQITLRECIHLMNAQGFRKGWYRGTAISLMRDIPATAIWFGTYQTMRAYLRDHQERSNKNHDKLWTLSSMMFSGAMAAILQWTATMPLDTIKTRLQMNRSVDRSHLMTSEPPSIRQVIREILATRQGSGFWNSIRVFYRGYSAAVIRAVPGSMASWLGTEAMLHLLSVYRNG